MHHPFTMPFEEDIDLMQDDATKPRVRSQAYDVVLNGVELGSGSVRIHRQDVQSRVFSALGFSKEEARERFGFLLGAFRYGTPPHAGFAFGLDRLVMLLLGASSLRDVIAFPKIKDASCAMTGAPDYVDPKQLEELKLGMNVAESGKRERDERVSRETVRSTATLSMLSLSPTDEAALDRDFMGIVDFAGTLSQLDRQAPAAPIARNQRGENTRADAMQPSFPTEAVLRNAQTTSGPYITVPRTFD